LYHVSLSKEKLKQVAFDLMNLVLFPKEDDWFFNYTCSGSEISMVMTAEMVSMFPAHTLQVYEGAWRAMAVFYGSYQHHVSGSIDEVSSILANAGISIYHLGTGNNDYILVQEAHLPLALQSLKEHYRTIRITQPKPQASSPPLDLAKVKQEAVRHTKGPDCDPKATEATGGMECRLLKEELYFCRVNKEDRPECAQALLRMIFKSESNFFSFTETEDEISLIIEQKDLKGFSVEVISDPWRPIQRLSKASLFEVGVIHKMTLPISAAKIPLVYLNTFDSAFIFVQTKNFKSAQSILEYNGMVLVVEPETRIPLKQMEVNKDMGPHHFVAPLVPYQTSF